MVTATVSDRDVRSHERFNEKLCSTRAKKDANTSTRNNSYECNSVQQAQERPWFDRLRRFQNFLKQ